MPTYMGDLCQFMHCTKALYICTYVGIDVMLCTVLRYCTSVLTLGLILLDTCTKVLYTCMYMSATIHLMDYISMYSEFLVFRALQVELRM